MPDSFSRKDSARQKAPCYLSAFYVSQKNIVSPMYEEPFCISDAMLQCTMPLERSASEIWLWYPKIVAFANAPQLLLQEVLASAP